MNIRTITTATLLAITAFALTGCAGSITARESSAIPESIVAVFPAPAEGADRVSRTALMTGVLVVENGCVRFDNGTIPVFSDDDVVWDGTTLTYGDESYVVGDTVELGGGELTEEASAELIPAECGTGRGWGVAFSSLVLPSGPAN